VIREFTGRYAFLSNFYPARVHYEGIWYPTTEHAFQAAKSYDHFTREWVATWPTPGQAKKAGRTIKIDGDWEARRVNVMSDVLALKFVRDGHLARMLDDTGSEWLQEGNTWGDTFWGVDLSTRVGDNMLGQLLMVRRELNRTPMKES
jgi:hypothetical protein